MRTLILQPRGALKTTIGTIAASVWRILRDFLLPEGFTDKFTEATGIPVGTCAHTIGVGSENLTKASDMVTAVRRHFERPKFIELFGDMTGKVWRTDRLTFKGAHLGDKEANVTAFGMDASAVASMHFKELHIDDPNTFENTRTFFIRDQMHKRFKTDVLPTLEPAGHKKIIRMKGTRYDPDDIYGRCLETGDFGGHSFEHLVVRALNDQGESFWPQMFPLETLLKKREADPVVFALQYQNDVEEIRKTRPVQKKWAKEFISDELNTFGMYKVLAIDPGGITEKEENSGMGVVLVGADAVDGQNYGKCYALVSELLYEETFTAAKSIFDIVERWQPDRIVVEEGALQKVFQHVFAEEARRRQLSQFINKIEGVKTSDLHDKVTLARAVQPMWTRGQVHVDKGKTPQLYNKLEDYPRQGTDDVNALLIALWYLQQGWVGRMTKRKERQKKRETAPVGHFGQAVRGAA